MVVHLRPQNHVKKLCLSCQVPVRLLTRLARCQGRAARVLTSPASVAAEAPASLKRAAKAANNLLPSIQMIFAKTEEGIPITLIGDTFNLTVKKTTM